VPIVAAIAVPHPPLIIPQVGRGDEKTIQKTVDAYRAAMAFLAAQAPESLVLVSPHADLYAAWFQISPGGSAKGDFGRFGAPGVQVRAQYDTALAAAITAEAKRQGLPAGPQREHAAGLDHGSSIPLYFLQQAGVEAPVVRVGLSGLSLAEHYRLGQCITAAAGDRRVAFVASGDLSHYLKKDGPYGYRPEGPQLDAAITGAFAGGDFDALLGIAPPIADQGGECGLRSFVMMAGALDGRAVEAKLLSYEGTFGVGYAVATFLPGEADGSRHFLAAYEAGQREAIADKQAGADAWVKLARAGVESWVKTGKRAAIPKGLPAGLLDVQAGVFVSLHKHGALRGCIGTTGPTTGSVAEEIVQNAASAATEDPRFAPVRPDELDALEISVDVLGAPEAIASQDELDVKRYGVIVSSGGRRGLLLPDLDGVDTVAQQVDIARQKAGIPPGRPLKLERFEVIRHA